MEPNSFYEKSEKERRILTRNRWNDASGLQYFDDTHKTYSGEKYHTEFLRRRKPLLNQLTRFLQLHPIKFDTICEIGTGNGMFINHLSHKFTSITTFVGIDIVNMQIEKDKAYYPHINFKCIEAITWLKKNIQSNVLFIACGTLEYFTPAELSEFLNLLKTKPNAAIAIFEPVNMDFDAEALHLPRTSMDYSHNYPKIFEMKGYDIFGKTIVPVDETVQFYQEISMIATANLKCKNN